MNYNSRCTVLMRQWQRGRRIRREEGGLLGIEGARGLTGGARCGWGGEAGGWLWSPLEEEEETEACEGEGKLAVGAVGVAEEKAATLAAFWKEKSFWARWWPLLLLLPLLPRSQWQRRGIFTEERERERGGATTT